MVTREQNHALSPVKSSESGGRKSGCGSLRSPKNWFLVLVPGGYHPRSAQSSGSGLPSTTLCSASLVQGRVVGRQRLCGRQQQNRFLPHSRSWTRNCWLCSGSSFIGNYLLFRIAFTSVEFSIRHRLGFNAASGTQPLRLASQR